MKIKNARIAGLLCLMMLVAGCSRSSSPVTGPNAGSTSSSWTTLGTRVLTSQPGTAITSNADAKWTDYDPPVLYPNTVAQNVQYVSMPDGTQLAVYVTLPADSSGKVIPGTFPTALNQTAYNNSVADNADALIIKHGYASVVVDVRGTGQSTGSWEAFGADEQSDYGNVVDWVTQQPWSNGAIGLIGGSYDGITAILTAAQNHPAVKATFALAPIGDGYRDTVFTGGQVNPTFVPLWLGVVTVAGITDPTVLTNPSVGIQAVVNHILSAITNFQVPTVLKGVAGDPGTAYDNPAPGSFWQIRSPLESDNKVTVPTFIVGGLHDIFQRSEPISYEEIKTHAPAKLLIGPWEHFTAGSGLPVDGVPVFDHIELQWFDQYVKGMNVGADRLPNVTQYVSGHGHYVTATDWPNPQAQAQKLYLHGDQSLSSTAPATGEASNLVAQEPINGLCSISAAQWTAGALGVVPLPCFTDDNAAELTDVKYQTAPLTQDMYINGPIEADVWMSTTTSDAGLSVRIDDVDASGNVTALTNGIQTASLRAVDTTRSRFINGLMIQPWHPFTQASAQPLTSGTPVLVPVEIFPTSAMIAKGHSLRVAIGASDLPQGVPPVPTLLQSLAGVLTIYSDAARPSSVVIPVVPTSTLN
jgi:putative CocE/NonD family hydrolase